MGIRYLFLCPRNKCKCPSTSERLNANLMNDLENTADPIRLRPRCWRDSCAAKCVKQAAKPRGIFASSKQGERGILREAGDEGREK